MNLAKTEAIFWKAFELYKKENNTDNALLFLTDSYIKNFQRKASLFGKRIELQNYKCTHSIVKEDYNFKIACDVVDLKGNVLLKDFQLDLLLPKDKINVRYTSKMFEILIRNGFNGFLTSPFEKETLCSLNNLCLYQSAPQFTYVCEECQKKYKTAKGFLSHLKKTKHKDSIVEQYGWGVKECI